MLYAECESLRKSIEENAKASKEAENELRHKLSESENALAEERKLAKSAAEATQVVRANLDAALDSNKWLDKELVSKFSNLFFAFSPGSSNYFFTRLCRCLQSVWVIRLQPSRAKLMMICVLTPS